MKLGIVSDIHEADDLLAVALDEFRRRRVDQVVTLGDLFETGARLGPTVDLLRDAGAVGVYGNHDHGLCVDPSSFVLDRYDPAILDYMKTLQPRLEVDGVLFAHREPWLDGREVTDIWHVDDGESLTPPLVARSFAAAPNRAILIGHFHRWAAYRPSGPCPWTGSEPLRVGESEPTLVVVHAVCNGFAATLDTRAGLLDPLDLYALSGRDRPEARPLPAL